MPLSVEMPAPVSDDARLLVADQFREHGRVVHGFTFSTDVRVRFAETDAQGIAHNSNYFVWFEVARVEYLERYAGGYQRLRDQGDRGARARVARPLPAAGGLRRPARRPRALRRREGRALPLRVRGRARTAS